MKSYKQARREAKQLFRLCVVNQRIDENRIRQVAQHLAGSGSRDGRRILGCLLRLVKLDLARRTAGVESATPLPPDLQLAIRASLARRYGEELTVTFAHQPALIGGLRIQVGSDVYDGSVRARLAALKKSF